MAEHPSSLSMGCLFSSSPPGQKNAELGVDPCWKLILSSGMLSSAKEGHDLISLGILFWGGMKSPCQLPCGRALLVFSC